MERLSKKNIFLISEGREKKHLYPSPSGQWGLTPVLDVIFSLLPLDALRNPVPKAGGFAQTPLVPNESKWHFESLFTLVALGWCNGCVV